MLIENRTRPIVPSPAHRDPPVPKRGLFGGLLPASREDFRPGRSPSRGPPRPPLVKEQFSRSDPVLTVGRPTVGVNTAGKGNVTGCECSSLSVSPERPISSGLPADRRAIRGTGSGRSWTLESSASPRRRPCGWHPTDQEYRNV